MQEIQLWDFRYGEVSCVCWKDFMAEDKGNPLERLHEVDCRYMFLINQWSNLIISHWRQKCFPHHPSSTTSSIWETYPGSGRECWTLRQTSVMISPLCWLFSWVNAQGWLLTGTLLKYCKNPFKYSKNGKTWQNWYIVLQQVCLLWGQRVVWKRCESFDSRACWPQPCLRASSWTIFCGLPARRSWAHWRRRWWCLFWCPQNIWTGMNFVQLLLF